MLFIALHKSRGMVSIKKLFSPGSGKFHDYFDEVASNLVAMSAAFSSAIYASDPAVRKTYLVELVRLEEETHTLAHRLFAELGKTFITPFDREDMYTLVGTLDAIAHHMFAIVRQLKNYNITEVPQPTKNVANNLQVMIKKLADAIYRLKDKRTLEQIYPLCQDIKKATDLCASLTDAAISRIYSDEQDPYEVIKKLDHYEKVHNMLDRCYTATNVIESVIIKYA
jgi:hypothetical protein